MSENIAAELTRRYFYEVFNRGDMQALEEICSPDFVFSLPTHEEPFRGVEGYKGLVNMLRSCFPDVLFAIEDQVFSEDRVLTRWTARGTHTGIPFPTVIGDVPATGNRFTIEGMTWHQVKDGKLAEVVANEDGIGLIYQLGRVLFPG
ncbi:MAG: ester cyclase, partial [Acidimicrobiales bacterium]